MKIGKKLLALNLALLMMLAILPFGALAADLVPGQTAQYVKTSSNSHEHMTFTPAETGVYTLTVMDGNGNSVRYDLVRESAPNPGTVPGPGTPTNLALRPVQSTESEAGVMAVTSTGVNLDLHVVPAYGSPSVASDKNALLFAGKTYEFYLSDKDSSNNGTYRFRIDRVDVPKLSLNQEKSLSKDGWLLFQAEKDGDYKFSFATPANLYTLNPAERHHGSQTLKLSAGDVCYIGESGYNTSATVTRIQDNCDHDWAFDQFIPATCTQPAYYYYTCTKCNDHKTEFGGEALGHDIVLKGAFPAYCESYGYTGDEVCSRCGETVKKGEWIAPLGHHWALDEIVAATCTSPSLYMYTCPDCNKQKTEKVGQPISHKTETRNAYPAYCESYGYTGDLVCTACQQVVKTGEWIAPLGHSWGEWVVTQAPTFAKDGTETHTCSKCGKTESRAVAKRNPFVDVIEGKYYFNAVEWAVFHDPQITNGTDKTHFEPNKACTRGEVVTFLWRAMGCPEPKSTECAFTDVSAKKFYYKAVLWAVENNITQGTSATTFGPNDPCTRGHVVTFLYRAKKATPVAADNPFTDVKPGKFYYQAVLWAVANDITKGESSTTFQPGKTCTRGQIVTFLQRADKV